MGALNSKKFHRNDDIIGQGKAVLIIGKQLRIRNRDIDLLFREFCKYEDPRDHLISLDVYFAKMKIIHSPFADMFFQLFDENKTGNLSFLEYMISIWNFLSCDDEILAASCFQLFDMERVNTLTIDEVKYMLNAVWSFNTSKNMINVFDHLKRNKDGLITLVEFILLRRHFPFILEPLYTMRNKIRKKTFTLKFWSDLAEKRFQAFGHMPIFAIIDRNTPDYVAFGLEYLAVRTGTPQAFAEQWRSIVTRKKLSKFRTFDVPFELMEFNPPKIKLKKKRNKWKSKRDKAAASLNYQGLNFSTIQAHKVATTTANNSNPASEYEYEEEDDGDVNRVLFDDRSEASDVSEMSAVTNSSNRIKTILR